jgi:hypothetical protein
MRQARRICALVAVLAAFAGGCTLLDFGSLQSGFGLDAGDAGPVGDGLPDESADAGADTDASVSPCLGGSHFFCDDFDDGVLYPTWKPSPLAGALMLTDAAFVSPPYSLSAVPMAADMNTLAFAEHFLMPDASSAFHGTIHLQLDFQRTIGAPKYELVEIDFTPPDASVSEWNIQIYAEPPSLTVGANWPGEGGSGFGMASYTDGGWQHLDMTIPLSEDGGSMPAGLDSTSGLPNLIYVAMPPSSVIDLRVGVVSKTQNLDASTLTTTSSSTFSSMAVHDFLTPAAPVLLSKPRGGIDRAETVLGVVGGGGGGRRGGMCERHEHARRRIRRR